MFSWNRRVPGNRGEPGRGPDGQEHIETGPPASGCRDLYPAPMSFGDGLGDGQAQTETLFPAVPLAPEEPAEDARHALETQAEDGPPAEDEREPSPLGQTLVHGFLPSGKGGNSSGIECGKRCPPAGNSRTMERGMRSPERGSMLMAGGNGSGYRPRKRRRLYGPFSSRKYDE